MKISSTRGTFQHDPVLEDYVTILYALCTHSDSLFHIVEPLANRTGASELLPQIRSSGIASLLPKTVKEISGLACSFF